MKLGSPYRTMWVMVFYDLPVTDKEARKEYQKFHKNLLEDGFNMMQYSVYIRCCPSPENAEVHMRRVESMVPPEGQVRVLQLTGKQFERMKIYEGEIRLKPEKEMRQLELF